MRIDGSPDRQRGIALVAMALTSLERLETTDMTRYPSNTITDFYDILHKLMDAIAIAQGVKFRGDGAHQELIEYMREAGHIDERSRILLQELRDYRNRIMYEGYLLSAQYLTQRAFAIRTLIAHLRQRAPKR